MLRILSFDIRHSIFDIPFFYFKIQTSKFVDKFSIFLSIWFFFLENPPNIVSANPNHPCTKKNTPALGPGHCKINKTAKLPCYRLYSLEYSFNSNSHFTFQYSHYSLFIVHCSLFTVPSSLPNKKSFNPDLITAIIHFGNSIDKPAVSPL